MSNLYGQTISFRDPMTPSHLRIARVVGVVAASQMQETTFELMITDEQLIYPPIMDWWASALDGDGWVNLELYVTRKSPNVRSVRVLNIIGILGESEMNALHNLPFHEG